MTENTEQFVGGTLSGNGNNVEVCADSLDLAQVLEKIAIVSPQMHDLGPPSVPGQRKSDDSQLFSTTNDSQRPSRA